MRKVPCHIACRRPGGLARGFWVLSVLVLGFPLLAAQTPSPRRAPEASGRDVAAVGHSPAEEPGLVTTEDRNQRLLELLHSGGALPVPASLEYRIGPEDLLEITVFDAPELNRSVRVSASGEISLPLLGSVTVGGLAPRELELVLQELLRRTYMKDPHVGVFVREMQSHPVSVVGAVRRPGVFQIRGSKTVLEMLSLAEGLAPEAGDTVIVMRASRRSVLPEQNPGHPEAGSTSPSSREPASEMVGTTSMANENEPAQADRAESVEVNLKDLLESGDPGYNLAVYPGDIVKVTRAGVVYVVGEVNRPGGFALSASESISVVQAIALSEGFTRTAAKKSARIIRTDERTGQRTEIALDLTKILAGQAPDPLLQAKDVLFVPNSTALSVLYGATEAARRAVTLTVFRYPGPGSGR